MQELAGLPSSEAKQWKELRKTRNILLASTDWTVMPDSPLSTEKQAEFRAYRQALRDYPQNWIPSAYWEPPTKPEL